MNIKCYELSEITRKTQITSAILYKADEQIAEFIPFIYQPIDVSYDIEGIEHIKYNGDVVYKIRFCVRNEGEYLLKLQYPDTTYEEIKITICGTSSHGFIKVSEQDKRYFSFSDSTPFFPIGINLAFPTAYGVSNGEEFGLSTDMKYIGLRQYEYWIKRCSENGVNMVRIWLGHDYLTPDTQDAGVFRYEQFTKLDMLVDIAKKYGVYLKFTVEQFRHFKYDDNNEYLFKLFNKKLYSNGKRCESVFEWFTEDKWRSAWLKKIKELSARYAYDTCVFALELWNETNFTSPELFMPWNEYMIPKIKKLFPNTMIVNSLGSLCSARGLQIYKSFLWNKFDFKQMHRYLDQGAEHPDSRRTPIEVIQKGMEYIKDDNMPFIVAETGAVNNNHSGPFKYYSCDDRGIIFVDCVYTPIFLGSASCGNIWHWDNRYVEAKNLYKYFSPLFALIQDVDFPAENFVPKDLSDNYIHLFLLEGKTITLGFIRNKADTWYNTLRDGNAVTPILSKQFNAENAKDIKVYKIWDEDTTSFSALDNTINVNNILYGTLFKIYNK